MREKDYIFCSDCKYCEICSEWDYGILAGCFDYFKMELKAD
jgi:hypothetical protein